MNLELENGLSLSEFRRSDREAIVEHLADKAIYDSTSRIPYPYSATDADGWFDQVERLTVQHGQNLNWAIRDVGGRLIGGVGLETANLEKSHRAEIGYWLARPFWGRGIMTTVVRSVCSHAFDNLRLAKLTAGVFDFNTASARVLEKCGFEEEGFLKWHYCKDGRFINARVFGRVS